MKALKIIGIIVAVLVAAILIIPLFAPSPAEVSSSIEISLEPGQIYSSLASFEGRTEWDPWVTMDSTATADIVSKPGYVGSTYAWEGVATGTGRMEVVEIRENEYIRSYVWFGDAEEYATVEWDLEQVDGGTQLLWSFSQDTKYPFGRLGMMIGAGFLKQSFDRGLANLKEVLEANPPAINHLGPISIETQPAMEAMVAKGGGTMDEIAQELGALYGQVFEAVGKQQLSPAGPAFVHYLDFDEATGFSNYLAGVPVLTAGTDDGNVLAKSYPEMKVLQAVHTGSYELFEVSYGRLDDFILSEGLDVRGDAFEFYKVSMQDTQDPAQWQTLIAFPLN